MPNGIKYNLSAETLALKKGNFYIATGDVGKGPTSTSGFYNGITPPSSGYTIYLNKASNGPSIYVPSNDSQLISLTNGIAGTSFTGATQCLNYYATQTDKMVFNRDYEGIITNGLVLNLDAGFTPSYSTSGVTWYDLSNSGNNGTLTNGPTFNSSNGGSIVFDGVDDYVDCGTNSSTLLSAMTISSTFSFISYSSGTYLIVSRLGGSPSFRHNYFFGLANFGTGTKFYFGFKQSGSSVYPLVQINLSPVLNTIYNFTATYSTSTSVALYLNGQSQSITGPNTVTNPLITNQVVDTDPTTNCSIGSGAPSQNLYYSNARVYNTLIYNRALSAAEVLQNYNAQKSRFGL